MTLDTVCCTVCPTDHRGTLLISVRYAAVVYSWTNCAMVLFGGPLIDKTSNRLAAIIFSSACLLGQVILSVGAHLKIFPVMLAGRILFGIGLGNITVVQNAITVSPFIICRGIAREPSRGEPLGHRSRGMQK